MKLDRYDKEELRNAILIFLGCLVITAIIFWRTSGISF